VAPEGTKAQIIRLLQGWGEATVTHLAQALDMSPAAIRRHLDGLRAEGLVDARPQRQGVGRPSFLFYATERAEELTSAGYSRLLGRMFRGLVELRPEEISGQPGKEVLGRVFERVAEHLAEQYGPQVVGDTLEERVPQAVRVLQAEGILDRWDRGPEGFRLINSACPYRRAALATDQACSAGRLVIQLLLGWPVEQVGRVVEGHPFCEYVVKQEVAQSHNLKGPARSEMCRRGARRRATATN
jgi:DeoR family suf operon transcriptional repressor